MTKKCATKQNHAHDCSETLPVKKLKRVRARSDKCSIQENAPSGKARMDKYGNDC